ncbi:RAMP superfamily CRISPR-associated protein [Hydrogenophaga sp. NH-16]|uniref:RAMP superfamily CRISPR-associated protein n=1 Tax=Hydrogenophaga sp. NH-16 TaxID=2184519 RepID=UPI000FD6EE75|nr:RAMP superfamily CRISPR-associated protein [Hydrogenophaga sp. NH-16]
MPLADACDVPTADPLALDDLRKIASGAQETAWHSVTLSLETITPIYGGGSEAGQADLLLPFRPRAIRNSLRHWWWLLNRQRHRDDSEGLYRDMAAIWGAAADGNENPGARVRVRVLCEPLTEQQYMPYVPFRINHQRAKLTPDDDPSFFALWVAKPKETEVPEAVLSKFNGARGQRWSAQDRDYSRRLASVPGLFTDADLPVHQIVLPGVRWSLHIHMAREGLGNAQKAQVRDAINAWLKLGGVGARTSRGMGRSRLIEKPETMLPAFLKLSDVWDEEVPWFTEAFGSNHALRDFESAGNALQAWTDSLRTYRTYRQARQKNERGQRMKQSYGHLANAVRKATNRRGHPIPRDLDKGGAFSEYTPTPELLFGAPIVYRFKGHGEPHEGEVAFQKQETALERYASPLLVTVVRHNNGLFVPAALCFKDHWHDVLDKWVAIPRAAPLPPGRWWPDISTPDGQATATRLMGSSTRNEARPREDPLRSALLGAVGNQDAPIRGDPIRAFINFFNKYKHERV